MLLDPLKVFETIAVTYTSSLAVQEGAGATRPLEAKQNSFDLAADF